MISSWILVSCGYKQFPCHYTFRNFVTSEIRETSESSTRPHAYGRDKEVVSE